MAEADTILDTVSPGDFIELAYTAMLKDGTVFDSSKGKGIVICIGKKHILAGIDDALPGKEIGKTYTIALSAEQAFGKKNPSLLQLIPTARLQKENIRPVPGLQLTIDGAIGTVKSVSGGRTLVDMNHPLAGHDIEYEIRIIRKVNEPVEKVRAFFAAEFNVQPDVQMTDGAVIIALQHALPEAVEKEVCARLQQIVPEVKHVTFSTDQKPSTDKKLAEN